ncbi:MAG: tail protein X [Bacteroidales bacterium]
MKTTTIYKDRWDSLAYDLCGDAGAVMQIMLANKQLAEVSDAILDEGQSIIIPDIQEPQTETTNVKAPWK